MRWLDGITDSMDVSLSELEAWRAVIHGVAKSWTQQNDKTTTLLTVGEIKDGRKQHQLFLQGIY